MDEDNIYWLLQWTLWIILVIAVLLIFSRCTIEDSKIKKDSFDKLSGYEKCRQLCFDETVYIDRVPQCVKEVCGEK